MDGRLKIAKYRKKIDRIDAQLISLLLNRRKLASKIGIIKQQHSIPIEDSNRETTIILHMQQLAASLDPSSIDRIWREIFLLCREVQRH